LLRFMLDERQRHRAKATEVSPRPDTLLAREIRNGCAGSSGGLGGGEEQSGAGRFHQECNHWHRAELIDTAEAGFDTGIRPSA
jgi:hypothetical protein